MLVADGLKFLWSVLVLLFDAKFVLMVVCSCPVSDCTFDGPLKRVLAHLRSSHHPNDCPAAFVEEINVQTVVSGLLGWVSIRQSVLRLVFHHLDAQRMLEIASYGWIYGIRIII